MKTPDRPPDEAARLDALRELDLLDTPPESRFDSVTRIAQRLFDVPTALISLVDSDRQWFKSRAGLTAEETSRDVSFCGHAVLQDEPFIVPDASIDERFADNPLVLGEPHIRFYAGRPLRTPDGHKIGTLCLIDTQPRSFGSEDLDTLADLASIVEREISAVHMATVDELTQLSNRRGFRTIARQGLGLCIRQHLTASLVFMDCDDFKQINDAFGHAEGDRALKRFASALKAGCREADVIARLGGDEFVVLLVGSRSEDTEQVVARVQESLRSSATPESPSYTLSFSHGIVEFDPEHPKSIEALLEEGDASMYADKTRSDEPSESSGD